MQKNKNALTQLEKKHFHAAMSLIDNLIEEDKYDYNNLKKILKPYYSENKVQIAVIKKIFGPASPHKYIIKINSDEELNHFLSFLIVLDFNEVNSKTMEENLDFITKNVVMNIKTHTGKLVNPSSQTSIIYSNKSSNNYKYIHSSSIDGYKKYSYSGNAMFQGNRYLLESAFYFNNKLCFFIDLLLNNDKLIMNFASKYKIEDKLKDIKEKLLLNTYIVKDDLPQTLFPILEKDGTYKYIAVTALPSFSVLNLLREKRPEYYLKSTDVGVGDKKISQKIKTNNYSAGGAQPQNVASFNSDVGGVHVLYKNIPPFVKKSKINWFKPSFIIQERNLPILKMKIYENGEQKIPENTINRFAQNFIEDFIQNSLNILFYIKENHNDFSDNIKNSEKLHILEKQFLLSNKFSSDIVDYFNEKLHNNFFILFREQNKNLDKNTFNKLNSIFFHMFEKKSVLKNILYSEKK